MCGIAGYLFLNKKKIENYTLIKAMTDSIQHRGPDGEGHFIDGEIALGHRRLSIIDINTGSQPMFSDDQTKAIIFNGEIYNYLEIREELKKKGIKFRTESDTEVVLKAYLHWGYSCQERFNGMWSFAIWDIKDKSLFISRDRIGEKPLHYSIFNDAFVFGSEIKALVAFGVPKIIRPELIQLYLSLTNIPAPDTFYKDIYKLMPGHFLIVKNNEVSLKKYWDLPEIDENNMLSNKSDVYSTFEYLFNDSVKIRMRSDVPFGAFLSGGMDSSSVVASMTRNTNLQVKTFTIGFKEKSFDESKLAEEVSRKFNTDHFLGFIDPDSLDDVLHKLAFHYDEPFGDSSAIPTGYVSKFAVQKVKMVLTGDGGDEILSGYRSFQGIKLANLINQFPNSIVQSIPSVNDRLARIFSGKIRYKLNKASSVIKSAGLSFEKRSAHKKADIDLNIIEKITKSINHSKTSEEYYSDLMKACSYKNDFYKLMFTNFKHDLPNDYLVKVDRMSMAYSLETRLPFLDHRLIEYMVKVDKNVKMQGWERKSILRNTIGKELPINILNAPKKGFGIPLREWFKEDAFNTYLEKNTTKIMDVLDKKVILEIISDNKSGKKDNGNLIWTLLMLNKSL